MCLLMFLNISVAGFGQSKSSKKPGDRAQFLASFIKQEKMGKPVLVSPSMSGSYSIPYLFRVFTSILMFSSDKMNNQDMHRSQKGFVNAFHDSSHTHVQKFLVYLKKWVTSHFDVHNCFDLNIL